MKQKKIRPSADGSREVWGAIARESTALTEGLHPLGPPDLPLERSAVPSHAAAFSPRTTLPCLSGALAVAASTRALTPSRRALVRGPERVRLGPGEDCLRHPLCHPLAGARSRSPAES